MRDTLSRDTVQLIDEGGRFRLPMIMAAKNDSLAFGYQ